MSPSTRAETAEKHPVDQVLPAPQMFVYGLQHVLSMYAGVVAVLLNLVFNILGRAEPGEAPIFAEGPAPAAISEADEERLDPHGPAARGEHYRGNA